MGGGKASDHHGAAASSFRATSENVTLMCIDDKSLVAILARVSCHHYDKQELQEARILLLAARALLRVARTSAGDTDTTSRSPVPMFCLVSLIEDSGNLEPPLPPTFLTTCRALLSRSKEFDVLSIQEGAGVIF